MTTKQTTKQAPAVKTDPSAATVDATYAFTGRGKTRVYMAAIPVGTPGATPGTLVRIHASYGGTNLGKLISIVSTGPDKSGDMVDRWSFDRVAMTPEQIAHNRALKQAAQAAYWESDKGQQTAERIARRQAEAEALKAAPPVAVAPVASTPVATAPVQVITFDRVALISDLKAAGFSLPEIMAEVARMSDQAASTPAPIATVKATAPTVKAPTVKATAGTSDCPSCGKHHMKLYPHVAGIEVCSPCMDLDAPTITQRVARKALGK